jgi:hypothetical protein
LQIPAWFTDYYGDQLAGLRESIEDKKCSICGHLTKSKTMSVVLQAVTRHYATHFDKKIPCPHGCPETLFSTDNTLAMHLNRVHPKVSS